MAVHDKWMDSRIAWTRESYICPEAKVLTLFASTIKAKTEALLESERHQKEET